jgi:hypothetical protein
MSNDTPKQDLDLELLKSAAWVGTVHDLLMRDTLLCLQEWKAHKDRAVEGAFLFEDGELDRFQFWFRALVRSFATQVEGTCYYLRKASADAFDRGRLPSLPAELRPKLLEEDPNTPGRKRYNSFLENVELGFEWFAAAFGKSFKLPKGDHRWGNFRQLVECRNQITHPKSLQDFAATAHQILPAQQGMLWFSDSFKELVVSCGVYVAPEERERQAINQRSRLPQKTQQVWSKMDAVREANQEAWRSRKEPDARRKAERNIRKAMADLVRTAGIEVPASQSDDSDTED